MCFCASVCHAAASITASQQVLLFSNERGYVFWPVSWCAKNKRKANEQIFVKSFGVVWVRPKKNVVRFFWRSGFFCGFWMICDYLPLGDVA